MYEATYAFQIFAVAFDAFANAGFDMIPSGFMIYIGMQLDLLHDTLLHIRLETETVLGKKRKMDEKVSTEDFDEKIEEIAIECVKHHLFIMK